MRILHIIRSTNPAGGGPIEGIKQLAAVKEALGHDVNVLCLDPPDAPWLAAMPMKTHAIGPSLLSYGLNRRLVPWLTEHAREYDMVVVNGIWQYNSFGTWRALRKTGQPYCVFTHGMLDPWFKKRYPLKHLKKWLYWPWAEYRVLRDAKAVLFTCEQERLMARQSFWLYRCNEVVVNYGVAGPPGDADSQRQAVLDRFPELRGKRVLLFFGRIHEKKGCDLLIRAFAEILKSPQPDLCLVLAGPDQTGWAVKLRALAERCGIADRIVWTGMLTGDLKWGILRLAEVFVLPSHQENFGIAVAEALACGTPVLISDKVNIWREIGQDRAGFVDADDRPGTVRVLEKWLGSSAEEKRRMGKNAHACFQSRFEIHRAAASLLEAFRK